MRVSVKYTTMIVEDSKASVAFYHDILGFEQSYHVDLPGNGQITLMQSPEGGTVELIEQSDLPKGFWSMGTDVDNLKEVIEHLEENGIEHTPIVQTSVGHMCFITDPNGIKICLIEHDIKKV